MSKIGDGTCLYIAIGRLTELDEGGFADGKHVMIASALAHSDNGQEGDYKTHMNNVMNKAEKIASVKSRLRLRSKDGQYELHVVPYKYASMTFVVFIVTDDKFCQVHNISKLIGEVQEGFFEDNLHDENSLTSCKANSSVNKRSQNFFKSLFEVYSKASKISQVQSKVDEVRKKAEENVSKALENVQDLDEMEENAQQFEKNARVFDKKATKVQRASRWEYYKTNIMIGVAFVVVILIIVAAICGSGEC